MRFKEFKNITEASLISRGTYSHGHQVVIATQNQKVGQLALDIAKKNVPNFDPSEVLTWVKNPGKNNVDINIGKGLDKIHLQRPNSNQTITLVGSYSQLEKALNHATTTGKKVAGITGDFFEATLGAAITAKLIKRQSDKIGSITVEDIQNILRDINKTSENEMTITKTDFNTKNIADQINLKIKLKGPTLTVIKDESQWKNYQNLFTSAMNYANNPDAERYSNYFYKNGKVDEVNIISDGVSSQKTRKTDVIATVKDPKTGEVRTLKNIEASLKAGSKIYGQIGTGGAKGNIDKWTVSVKKLFDPLGVELDDFLLKIRDLDFYNFWIKIYQEAATRLKNNLTNQNAELALTGKLVDAIINQATSGNPDVKIIHADKGEATIHSFKILKNRMIEREVDLDARYDIGKRSGKPSIFIFDKNQTRYKKVSDSMLTAIRFFSTKNEDRSTHYFESGPLLHDLTKLNKTKNK